MKPIVYSSLIILLVSCARPAFKTKWTETTAPEHFAARFETTKGIFEIEANRSWSPKAVDRLYALVKYGFYNNSAMYRVVANYVAQFANPMKAAEKAWAAYPVPDEPVIKENTKGTMSFARSTKDTRVNDMFINLKNNSPRLDTLSAYGIKGYPGLAVVTRGMEVVESFYSGYGNEPLYTVDTVKSDPRAFLQARYPKLDYIRKAYLIRIQKKN